MSKFLREPLRHSGIYCIYDGEKFAKSVGEPLRRFRLAILGEVREYFKVPPGAITPLSSTYILKYIIEREFYKSRREPLRRFTIAMYIQRREKERKATSPSGSHYATFSYPSPWHRVCLGRGQEIRPSTKAAERPTFS